MAAQELRSANAQVEYLLRMALQQRGRTLPVDTPADSSDPEKTMDGP